MRPNRAYFELFSGIPEITFIETGTQHGKGVREALDCGFKKVHSIEADQPLYDKCSAVLDRQIKAGSVELHFGPSETVLPALVKTIQTPIFYWLDAHFQGVELDAKNCPLGDEIGGILQKGPNDDDVIFIDDVRMLIKQRSWRGHDVVFESVLGKLTLNYKNHVGCFVDGYVPNDVFCLFPRRYAADFFALKIPAYVAPERLRQAAEAAEAAAAASASQ